MGAEMRPLGATGRAVHEGEANMKQEKRRTAAPRTNTSHEGSRMKTATCKQEQVILIYVPCCSNYVFVGVVKKVLL